MPESSPKSSAAPTTEPSAEPTAEPSTSSPPPVTAPATGQSLLLITVGTAGVDELQQVLAGEGFRTWAAPDRVDLSSLVRLRSWSLVLVFVPHPGPAALERCREIRRLHSGPLAALAPPLNEEMELALRAEDLDDVLVWPHPPRLLAARLRTLVKRAPGDGAATAAGAQAPIQLADLVIDPARREVRRGSRVIRLTDTELELLQLLARNLGRPVSREVIFQELRGFPYDGLDRSIDLRVSRLRRKLENGAPGGGLILTVRGVGYQLAAAAL